MKPAYELLIDDTGDWFVKLTEGLWSGIIYSYGRVSFGEKGSPLKLKYEWECNYAPDHLSKINFKDAELEEQLKLLLGKILIDILETYSEQITIDKNTNKLILKFDPPHDDK